MLEYARKLVTKIQRDGLRETIHAINRHMGHTRIGNAMIPARPPRAIAIELSSKCNLRCSMCALHSDRAKNMTGRRPTGHMDFDIFQKIVDEVISFPDGVHLGLNFGGESLLYPKFPQVLMTLKQVGLSSNSGFNTNGFLLSKELADMIIELFDGRISISIDGFRDSHENIRSGSSYDRVYENTIYLIERNRIAGARPKKLEIDVNLTKANQPAREIEEFIDYWSKIADRVSIYEQLSYDNKLITRNDRLNIVLNKGRKLCLWPFRYIAVLSDGSFTFCCHDIWGYGRDTIRANIKENKILDVWRGKEFKKLRDCLMTGRLTEIPACRNCETWAELYINEEMLTDRYAIQHNGTSVRYKRR